MSEVFVTLCGDRPARPLQRLLVALDIAGNDTDVRIMAHQAPELRADLVALLDVAQAAQAFLAKGGARDALCMAVNRLERGVAEHDWGAWGEPYRSAGGMSRVRCCRTCGDYEAQRVEDGGGLLGRVVATQLPADPCDGCDPGDCQCSVGRERRGGEASD